MFKPAKAPTLGCYPQRAIRIELEAGDSFGAQTIRCGVGGADLAISKIGHATTTPESKPNSTLLTIGEQNRSIFLASQPRPGELFDHASSAQMQKTPIFGKPEVARLVPGDEMHFFARYGHQGNKPPGLDVSKPAARECPDAPAIILKEGLRRIQLSTCVADNGDPSVIPLVQTIAGAKPYASVSRCCHGPDNIGRQTLSHGNCGDRKLPKTVEPSIGGHPDIAFT